MSFFGVLLQYKSKTYQCFDVISNPGVPMIFSYSLSNESQIYTETIRWLADLQKEANYFKIHIHWMQILNADDNDTALDVKGMITYQVMVWIPSK